MSNDMFWDSDANISFNTGVSNLDDGVGLRERGRSWYSNINIQVESPRSHWDPGQFYHTQADYVAHPELLRLPITHIRSHNIFGGCEMNLIKPCSFSINKLTANTPTMTVDYGGLYHSQSPEGLFMCTSGLKNSKLTNASLDYHLTKFDTKSS
ncbi:uncharacterized protein F5891DRAFT_982406 [Suillus fuscotomentosus]|uniref:Uncharacterized protein n=1 Tax=Suillus fuscotomentosus TaxID=1912939 RepID=A0AAD4E0X7_9AGAM|nr:uncharacterized protein F5891DRAFT_982406 [Suillus fuscotomentosus]KAG1897666.1 hypothetical protein F5891DRAFT_982406 [Suillus fuscotomentosus]